MWKAKVLGGGEQDLRSAIEMIENVEASGVRLLDDYRSVFDNDNKKTMRLSSLSIWKDTKLVICPSHQIQHLALTICPWP